MNLTLYSPEYDFYRSSQNKKAAEVTEHCPTAASAPKDLIVATAYKDTKIDYLNFSLCPPEIHTLLYSTYFSAYDSFSVAATCQVLNKLFHQLFAILVLKDTKGLSALPNKQEYFAGKQSTPEFLVSVIKAMLSRSTQEWTAQEIFAEFPKHVKDKFLPLSTKGQKILMSKGLDGPIIKHHLASGKCTLQSLESKYEGVHHEWSTKCPLRTDSPKFKVLLDCILVGLLNIYQAIRLTAEVQELLCLEVTQQAVGRREVSIRDITKNCNRSEGYSKELSAALLYWSQHPETRQQLTLKEVFDHPQQALVFMKNGVIRNIIAKGELEKSTFLSWPRYSAKMVLLTQPPVQQGLVEEDFTIEQVLARAELLLRPFDPQFMQKFSIYNFDPEPEREYYARYGFEPIPKLVYYAKRYHNSSLMACYFEYAWGNKLTLKDCVTADKTKIEFLLKDDDYYFADLVVDKVISLEQLLALPCEKLQLFVPPQGAYLYGPQNVDRKLRSGELSVKTVIELPLDQLTLILNSPDKEPAQEGCSIQ